MIIQRHRRLSTGERFALRCHIRALQGQLRREQRITGIGLIFAAVTALALVLVDHGGEHAAELAVAAIAAFFPLAAVVGTLIELVLTASRTLRWCLAAAILAVIGVALDVSPALGSVAATLLIVTGCLSLLLRAAARRALTSLADQLETDLACGVVLQVETTATPLSLPLSVAASHPYRGLHPLRPVESVIELLPVSRLPYRLGGRITPGQAIERAVAAIRAQNLGF